MSEEFEINKHDLDILNNVGEFEVWLMTLDDHIEFVSIDPLIEYLASKYHRPEFTIAALRYKKINNL